ncbi:MAG: methyltransferase, partial [Planctomycetes bacterium]|nr:methyltransferase [Planctomycetota bacterium]
RNVFVAAGYQTAAISKLLKANLLSLPSVAELPEMLRRTDGGSPFETFVRLFVLGVSAEVDAVRRALDPMNPDVWAKAGMLAIDGETVTATLRLLPFQGLLVATESVADTGARRPDFVLGISRSTLTLGGFTIRRRVRRMLDLGTGCGFQALLAAKHCEHVHATDRNTRAIAFARFNACLNGYSNIAFSVGDLFEPVRGELFDLVTTNPPFVISPESAYIYRDSGMSVDQFVRKTVCEVPKYLEDGGYFQMICNWAHVGQQKWQARLGEWFAGTGCDAWVIRRQTQTPWDYTRVWCDAGKTPQQSSDDFERWMAYYKREGIGAISTGFIMMRRRRAPTNWFRADDWTERLQEETGNDVLEGFGNQDFLESARDDAALLNARLRVSPRVRLEQQCQPSNGVWRCVGARVHRVGGLNCSGSVDPLMAGLIVRCDGKRPLGELLSELPISQETDGGLIRSPLLAAIRRLIARGILLPPTSQLAEPRA